MKAPFDVDGGVEFMWVDVARCHGGTLAGMLLNQPNGASPLRPGAKVEVELATAFDYLYEHAGGRKEGDETTAILMRREGLTAP